MKKILFFEPPDFTGATRVTRTIAKSLLNKYEVDFAVVHPGEGAEDSIRRVVTEKHPDILFSSFVSINSEVIVAGKSLGLYLVVRTDYKLGDVPDLIKERIYKTYPLADLLIAQTEEMGEELRAIDGVSPNRVRVVENPLDEEDILEKASVTNPFTQNGSFHFLWVGREDPIKDVGILRKAFKLVHQENPQTDLTLLSNEENPYKWIKHADCLVISSKSEASPNVLREALLLGTPVVSTDCSPTVSELLSKDRIVPVGDCAKLAEAMKSIIRERS